MSIAELIYQHSLNLPEHAAKQALAFIQFLEQQPQIEIDEPEPVKKRQAGSAMGQLVILQNDDQYLNDFKDYM